MNTRILIRRLLPMLLLCALATETIAQPGVWTKLPTDPPSNPLLYAVHFRDGLNGFVGGDDGGAGVLYRTANGGATWAPV
ncbi:MAG: hypothetical protein H7X80_08495, partial [bacterium]|nr:hypothetical protein [Candidatus Kapabacteria bacterium]